MELGNAVIMVDEMRIEDIDDVMVIEKSSFPTPWSRSSFITELNDNSRAYYYVARLGSRVVGYCGMWIIVDEGHITNIAVHPDFRRKGVGKALLCKLITEAVRRGVRRLTLEVRVSNYAAQALYSLYGFRVGGRRKEYYSDNREDAFIMWLDLNYNEL